jgi:hypothetical protein
VGRGEEVGIKFIIFFSPPLPLFPTPYSLLPTP